MSKLAPVDLLSEVPDDKRRLASRQAVTIALLFLGYASLYFCRADFSVALPMLAKELSGPHTAPDAALISLGSIASFGVLAYALGKFFLAGLGDRWGGRLSFLIGLAGALAFTMLFTAGKAVPLLAVAWVGNRLVQSVAWAGLVKVCSNWFSYKAYGGVIGVLSLSYLVGDAVAREWMAVLIAAGYGWRYLFYLAAAVCAVVLLANVFLLRATRSELGFSEPQANPLNVFGEEQSTQPRGVLLLFLKNRSFWLVCFLSFGTTIVRETFNTWTPAYLHNFFGYSESSAASTSAVFPAVGAISVLVAGFVSDRLGASGRSIVLFTGLSLATLGLFSLSSLTPGMNAALPWVLIGLVAFGLLGPYSYLAGAMALDLGGKRGGATSSGLIDGVGYLGGVLAGDSVARLSVSYGWRSVFIALAALSSASAIASGLLFLQQRKQVLPSSQLT